MAINYPRENRIFDDRENSNHRFYRESEAHGRNYIAYENLRADFGFEKKIYEQMQDPSEAYQEIQAKMYRSK